MTRPFAPTCLVLLCSLAVSAPVAARAYTGQELAPQAKVTLMQARTIALKAAPGTITDQEQLNVEPGGSGLRYSFDVKRGAQTFEVGVDAKTGAVLENKIEGPNPDSEAPGADAVCRLPTSCPLGRTDRCRRGPRRAAALSVLPGSTVSHRRHRPASMPSRSLRRRPCA